jgi:hypothetical protein
VYRVRLRVEHGGRTGEWTEWIAPRSRHCRREDAERTEIATPTRRATIAPPSWGALAGADVRAGSKAFVHGRLGESCAALVAFAAGLRPEADFRWHGRPAHARIEERIDADTAVRRKLFSLGGVRIRSYSLERALGRGPTLPIRAYWLGMSAMGVRATTTVEHYYTSPRGPGAVDVAFIVFYERPGSGRRGGEAGLRNPPGEIQVTSQPRTAQLARRTIRHFEASHRRYAWPRYRVRLANGERAVAYANLGEGRRGHVDFVVVTPTTLVGIPPRFSLRQIPGVASRLRPLPRR